MQESLLSKGHVVAVSMSRRGGVPKIPQAQIEVGPEGVTGDFHAGPINKHKKKGPPEPNRRQVTVVAQETLWAINAALGTALRAGDMGENILVEGHGDLSDLAAGDHIALGDEVVLEVTGQNRPCDVLNLYHPRVRQTAEGRRGITAVVLHTGTVRPGDVSRVFRIAKSPTTPPP